ncbi:MAG: 1,4-dihydroxy-2-naphthoate polyprenyltransferase [Acidimicrobiales bacterium]
MSPHPTGWKLWLAGARPRTLPVAVAPVLVGTAAAATSTVDGWAQGIVLWRFLATLVVSLSLQIAVNYFNDFSDGVRGTDDRRRVGPLRLVGSGLIDAPKVKRAGFLCLGVAATLGLVLASQVGWELLVVGLVSMLAAWFYTGGKNPYGYLGLGEAFVFVFFGIVATAGSAYVQVEKLRWFHFGVAIPVGLVAVAILVINNLRDIPGDTQSGKRTVAVRIGDARTRVLYTVLMVAMLATAVAFAWERGFWILLTLGAAPVAILAVREVQSGAKGLDLVPVLVRTGQAQLLLGISFSLALWITA